MIPGFKQKKKRINLNEVTQKIFLKVLKALNCIPKIAFQSFNVKAKTKLKSYPNGIQTNIFCILPAAVTNWNLKETIEELQSTSPVTKTV